MRKAKDSHWSFCVNIMHSNCSDKMLKCPIEGSVTVPAGRQHFT